MDKLIFIAMFSLVAAAAADDRPAEWNFEKEGLSIQVVGKDAEFDEKRAYQVVVRAGLRTLARLEVNRDGMVTDAWITDLDDDGAFEIVVATAQLAGTEIGAADVHEWQGFHFNSTKTGDLGADQRPDYRGNDQFTVTGGRLRRAYPIFADSDGTAVPTGALAEFEYRFGENRWEPEPP